MRHLHRDADRWLPIAGWGLDAIGAMLFAAGLSICVADSGRIGGPWLAGSWLPGLGLMVGGALLRGMGSGSATVFGVTVARAVLSDQRRSLSTALLSGRRRAGVGLGEMVTAAVDEIEAQEGFYSRFQPLRQAAVFAPVLVALAVAAASPVCALILLATLVPLVMLLAFVGAAAREASDQQFEALERLSVRFMDRVRALPLILAFQAEAASVAQVTVAAQSLSSRTRSVLRVAFLSSAALEFFAALSVALVAVYCGFRLLGLFPVPVPEAMDLQRAVFCLALAPEFYLPLRRLAAAYHDKQVGEAAAVRAQRRQFAVRPSSAGDPLDHAPALSFEQVCIAYEAGAEIGPVSFRAEPGQITVLVGPSGSGKTSLLKALLGLAPVRSGEIRVEAQALPDGLAASVAWAGQAPVILPASLADNIALADRSASRAQVLAAAQWAGLQDVIASRPGGLDTPLDERGSGLSGGERRRIALARAKLKASTILLLDEPTADLDPAAEAEFIVLIRQLAEGRTVILATHSEAVAALGHKVVRL